MKYLALLTPSPGRTLDEFGPYFVPEERVVWASYRDERLREAYFQPTPPAVILIYEAADSASVDAELDQLPMVKARLLDRQIFHLGPWLPLEKVFDKKLMESA
jgi:hypothetical protein